MNQNETRLSIQDGDNEKEIILIGTAHVSPKSVQQVKETIELENPDTVCIELDDARFQTINQKEKYQNTDLVKIIKDGKASLFLVNLILSNYQKKMAEQFNIQSGQEMLQAIDSANDIGANIVLADRDIQTTFKRIWQQCSFWEKTKLLGAIVASIFDNEEITEEDLEKLKQEDILTASMSELGEHFSGVKTALLDERDQYLSENIKNAPGKKIVAVLGAAHVPGVKKEINKDHDLEKLKETKKKGHLGAIIGWSTLAIFAILIAITFSLDFHAGIEQTRNWLILVMGGAGIGALIGGGCIQAIIVAIICAPLGALSPVLASGWFSGLAEAYFKKPKVIDFENLSDDITSIKGFWKNKVTRVLLVVMFTNLGCAIGNIAGSINIIKTFLDTVL